MSLLPDTAVPTATDESVNHGEIFTKRWVVEFILDLCGYTANRDLASLRLIEPACGTGSFLIAAAERLVESAQRHGRDLSTIREAILGIDLQTSNVAACRAAVKRKLIEVGLGERQASRLASHWVRAGNFLLDPIGEEVADLIVGNPPYIRLEQIPAGLSAAYREACPTMSGRSDIYIGFFERGLSALRKNGVLGFICADRWMRNAYGARLRDLISKEWAVDAIVSMQEVDAFEDEVDAYPAITVLRRGKQSTGPLVVDTTRDFDSANAQRLLASRRTKPSATGAFKSAQMPAWFEGSAGWPHGSPAKLAAISSIEQRLPTLEESVTGTRVGIGLASGADRVFVTDDPQLVEQERLLPMAMVRDLSSGELRWSGHYLVNPWDENGLVDLERWPKLEAYLTSHKEALSKRHTAKSGKWHRTIDRVVAGLLGSKKLYLPDFKEALFPVLDRGGTYPHHNLYWITSDEWDLEILGGILLSDVANMFISAYSVRMRGGYLRFQAQYLRRIRIPRVDRVDAKAKRDLRSAFRTRDRRKATEASLSLYELDAIPD